MVVVDIICIILSYFYVIICNNYDIEIIGILDNVNIAEVIIMAVMCILMFSVCGIYKRRWENSGTKDFVVLAGVFLCAVLPSFAVVLLLWKDDVYSFLAFSITCGQTIMAVRLFIRIKKSLKHIIKVDNHSGKNTLIVGAGEVAAHLIKEMDNGKIEYNPVVIVDDDKHKIGKYVSGVEVCGDRNDIKRLVDEYNIESIIFAISSIKEAEKKKILEICSKCGVETKIVPSVYQIIDQKDYLKNMKPLNLNDLLGRDEIKIDYSEISTYLNGKKVLVTGGGGSIGSELCRQIVNFNPSELIILDIYENNAYEIQMQLTREYPELALKVYIASVRDMKRLERIFSVEKPDVVFHAAAHKHVPLMEFNPTEAIKNNVIGTYNTALMADKYGVKRFVLISTDKAVNPTNIMGASKRACEMVIQCMDKKSKTEYVAVRFGNVLGSNGSVIPLFQEQIAKGGPVTVTHKDITRFFMSIPEAAQLVIQAGAYARGGEIFVLDMGNPVKIYNLAEEVIRHSGLEPHKDIEIDIIGLRPGEKLYEELLMNIDGLRKTAHDLIFVESPMEHDSEKIFWYVQEMQKLVDEGNCDTAVDMLAEMVPTFIRKVV